jgi:hypothetical protein
MDLLGANAPNDRRSLKRAVCAASAKRLRLNVHVETEMADL